ncbi:hypothetical protein O6H91_03G005600 [Diphasiastrum complanatum]|uniref:Uncharacterized protein n=1 Tax=Diphasiastrum complanatum TaxID=34168 RepID=A0ACC2E363_DIPCM|nr:hypothetical protein O6H91_03G005600 [Diphasiastrum complanatum]
MRSLRRQPVFDADYGFAPPMMEKRIRRLSSFARSKHETKLSCVNFPSTKKSESLITVLVGPERQPFSVEPQILDHGVIQILVEKTGSPVVEDSETSDYENYDYGCGILKPRKSKASQTTAIIHLDCDAILFDHILWLLDNDDPSIRYLNMDELMEFYSY